MKMGFSSTAKLTEMPLLHNTIHLRTHLLLSSSSNPSSFPLIKPFCCSSSLRTNNRRSHDNLTDSTKTRGPSAPWLNKWPSSREDLKKKRGSSPGKQRKEEDGVQHQYFDGDKGRHSIERIVHRLRNLGLESHEHGGEDEDRDCLDVEQDTDNVDGDGDGDGDEKLGDLLQRNWTRPDSILLDDNDNDDHTLLPWEREDNARQEEEGRGTKRRARAPTLAELTIEDVELRRLRTLGMTLKERISIPKAGVTQVILDKIHDKWRKSELVRLKFHETLAHDMKTAHEIVERRTGGLVTWRSGSVMVVYRGNNYQRPSSRTLSINSEGQSLFVPDIPSADNAIVKNSNGAMSASEKIEPSLRNSRPVESMTEEEAEYHSLLDGLGPRFLDWWGTGFLPIDADLLPPSIAGYRTPFRSLPTGMRSRLTNAEMTNLRKLAKSLPSHFALGRNRNHQGLASAIVRLWEKSLVAKIAVKRGIQNTNNKIMSEELKKLTGGILLLRNKYYIVIYRGKDFLPTSVAATLAERQELTREIQDVEEKARSGLTKTAPSKECEEKALAGTLAEFHEAKARWGREVSSEEHEKLKEEASRARNARIVRRVEHKLAIAQAKKLRAERLLAKIEATMVPAGPSDDQETLTDEERFMFRRIGLKMKAYLPIGIRGVFDGVIENMHLHWKHRELVKLISKQKTLSFVEDTARLLEYESGGILVTIERVPKGYALIYYRGKNYQRPISLRPRNLLTKAKALKRSVSMQRHEALSQHISELETTIEQMNTEMCDSGYAKAGNTWSSEEDSHSHGSEVLQNEEEYSSVESDYDDDDDDDDDDDSDSDGGNLSWEDDEKSGSF